MEITEISIYFVDDDGKKYITFPNRITWQGIEDLKVRHGSYNFNGQYLMNPIPEEDQVFDLNWLRYWKHYPQGLNIMFCVDPANTAKKRSDYTAISVHGWDRYQNWYVLDLYRDKLAHEAERAKKLFSMHKKWQQRSQTKIPVLYETVGFQILDKHYLDRKMIEDKYFFPIIELKGGQLHSTSKSTRIRAIQPYFEANTYDEGKKLYLPKNCFHYSQYEKRQVDMVQELIYEIQFFTPMMTHAHDDLIDTFTFPIYTDKFKNIMASPVKKQSKRPDALTYRDVIRSYAKSKNIMNKLPPKIIRAFS